MSKKSIILFILGMSFTIIQFIISFFTEHQEVLSVVICSLGILCFILLFIDMIREKKLDK